MSSRSSRSTSEPNRRLSVTSHTKTLARPPPSTMFFWISSSSLRVLLTRSTSAPARASATDATAPRPRPAPVTRATRPSRRKDSGRVGSPADMTSGIPAHADIGLFLMSPESLDGAETRAVFADDYARLLRALLIRNGLQELADPEPARIACSTLRGQRVICTDDFV